MKNVNGYIKYNRLYVLENIIKLIWLVIILLATNLSKIEESIKKIGIDFDITSNIIYIFATLFFVTFFYYYINYRRTNIKIEKGYIKIKKNIITEDATYIGFKNIANICIKTTLIGRAFKVSTLMIKCEKKNNICFDILITTTKDNIEKILENIGLKTYEKSEKQVTFSKFNIILHSLCMISISYIVIILNVINIVIEMIKTGKIMSELSSNLLGFLLTVFILLFPVLYNFFKNVFLFYNFKINKNLNNIVISYGMITNIISIVPIEKINGYVIKESIISKLFGLKYAKILNSGSDSFNSYLKLYIPVSTSKKVYEIIREIDSGIGNFGKIIYQDKKILDYIIYVFPVLFIISYIAIKFIKISIYKDYVANLDILNLFLVVMFLTYYFGYFLKKVRTTKNSICIISGIVLGKEVVLKYSNILITKKINIVSKGKTLFSKYRFKVPSDIFNNTYDTGFINLEIKSKINQNISC